jgi:hypothetical protein
MRHTKKVAIRIPAPIGCKFVSIAKGQDAALMVQADGGPYLRSVVVTEAFSITGGLRWGACELVADDSEFGRVGDANLTQKLRPTDHHRSDESDLTRAGDGALVLVVAGRVQLFVSRSQWDHHGTWRT